MKKNMIVAAAVLASAVACTKTEEPSADGMSQMSFSVSTEQTKTVLDGTNKTLWAGEEKLSIFDGESNNMFTAELAAPASTAQFAGKAKAADIYYALYPYSSAAKLEGTAVSTEIPASQTAVKDSFDPSAALLFGTAEGTNIPLHNVTAMLKLTVPANVTSIEVEGGGTAIAGSVSINVGSAEISGATESKVVLSGDGALEAGTYYIAVAPATVSGLSVKLIDSANGKYMLRSVNSSRTFKAKTIYNMGDFSSLEWTSEGGDEPAANDLVIFDSEFKTGYSIENNTMSIESVDGQNCLKWVFSSDEVLKNYGVIGFDPYVDFANFDADNTYLKFKFKVGVDNGPVDEPTVFKVYFTYFDGQEAENAWVGSVGRGGTSPNGYDVVVNDGEWHELSLSLKGYVASLSGIGAARNLGFTNECAPAAIGTTIYFKDIRISGNRGSSQPEQPKEDAQIIFDDAMQNGWLIGGTTDKYSIADGIGKDGGKGIEWVLDDSGNWARTLSFALPANTDISSYAKLCFDVEYVNSTFVATWVVFTNRVYGDGTEMYFHATAPENSGWHTVEMPLNDFNLQFGAKDWTKFKTFCFHTNGWNGGTATVHIDNVRLVK